MRAALAAVRATRSAARLGHLAAADVGGGGPVAAARWRPALRLPPTTPLLRTCLRALASSLAGDAPPTPRPIKPLAGAEIRDRFLRFFEARGHARLPSASLIPDDPTVLLTIAGMLQFKPIFLGQTPRAVPRATTSQKCIRTNDIDNVGATARHHTFFEMLGNFSFGDYFKEDAIRMAWELATVELGIPADRVWVSVYEADDEAARLWADAVGVPPSRIQRLGAADNFWASGPTGPCGPCSELYYDLHPERGVDGADLGDDSRFIEFYNLVFMESNRAADGSLTPLAAKNIDTGMGLERVAQILQGVPNNYETDLIFPIVAAAAHAAGVDYHAADDRTRTSLKVIGDHARAVTYLVSDGVTPSNVGRGYVLRRLIRRVVMKARLLGVQGTFLPSLAAVVADLSPGCDPGLAANLNRVQDELAREEARFSQTLAAGDRLLADALDDCLANGKPDLDGGAAFVLYDTYGFPLEVTQEVAAERGLAVDVPGFEAAMAEQKRRSKDSAKVVDLTAEAALGGLVAEVGATRFVGYEALVAPATVVALLADGARVDSATAGQTVDVLLDATPFYAEGGGQVGDAGELVGPGGRADVTETRRAAGGALSVHRVTVADGTLSVGDQVTATVDVARRASAAAHHTATHLLQAALKTVLGDGVAQQGSLVQPSRLRFDFNMPRAVEPHEIARIEGLVNAWVSQDHSLNTAVMPLDEAKAAGAVAMFGEKYDAAGVRVVDVPGVSMELCGGTHVRSTAQIGGFKVLSEAGIASGVRRIEAVVGPALVEYLQGVDGVVRSLSATLKVKADELPARVEGVLDELRQAQKDVAALRSELAAAKALDLLGEAQVTASGVKVLAQRLDGVDGKALQDAASALLERLGDPAVVFLISATDGGAVMATACSPGVVKSGVQAGKFIGSIAKMCGGGGGGRPHLAQAGGKDGGKVPEALEAARAQLLAAL